ncbi:MAG TPA: hypothetical protein VGT24_10040 [Candidatus Acidoferrales bacterium]|nr:hypothetical protein [Candidatus Acidoferrales bacterium]
MHPLIEYLGLQNAGRESEVLNKIFSDNLVSLRSQELMIEHFGFEAIQKMHPLERERLIKRICPPVDNTVRWAVSRGIYTNRPHIGARWRNEDAFFDGPPENAPLFEFHGEHPTAEILARYAALYDPGNAAQMDAAYWFVATKKYKKATPIVDLPETPFLAKLPEAPFIDKE